MNSNTMSDRAMLEEIGQRIRVHRLNLNLTQAAVAEKAGVSRRALQRLESGDSSTLTVLIRILRALAALNSLDAFLPKPGLSPLQLAKLKGHERKRASGRRA